MLDVAAHRLRQQAVELAVVREDDVPAPLPREPGPVHDGGRQASRAIARLEDVDVVVALCDELLCAGKATRAGADDQHPAHPHGRMLTNGPSRRRSSPVYDAAQPSDAGRLAP